jgi:hypothetical protein
MASYKSFDDRVALVELLAPSDETMGIQSQIVRDIAIKYVQLSSNFPELIRKLKKGEQTETDRNVTQAMFRVRMRAEDHLDDITQNT